MITSISKKRIVIDETSGIEKQNVKYSVCCIYSDVGISRVNLNDPSNGEIFVISSLPDIKDCDVVNTLKLTHPNTEFTLIHYKVIGLERENLLPIKMEPITKKYELYYVFSYYISHNALSLTVEYKINLNLIDYNYSKQIDQLLEEEIPYKLNKLIEFYYFLQDNKDKINKAIHSLYDISSGYMNQPIEMDQFDDFMYFINHFDVDIFNKCRKGKSSNDYYLFSKHVFSVKATINMYRFVDNNFYDIFGYNKSFLSEMQFKKNSLYEFIKAMSCWDNFWIIYQKHMLEKV